jgi:CubicO group peptidase (beta-lactamase class C family)
LVPLYTQPGTRWQYSIAVDVQGYLIEKLSGQPFAEFLKTRRFDPLWFWIDPVKDLVFVGMIQHRGRANSEIQGLSRNLVYQTLTN